jgi:hypothetical protein
VGAKSISCVKSIYYKSTFLNRRFFCAAVFSAAVNFLEVAFFSVKRSYIPKIACPSSGGVMGSFFVDIFCRMVEISTWYACQAL